MALKVRALTAGESEALRQLAHSRTAPAREGERAKMLWHVLPGESVPAVARRLGRSEARVRHWLKRFNARGLPGLVEQPRPGRPPVYAVDQVAEVMATTLSDPQQLGQPFGSWTLDRLEQYLNEAKGIGIKRSRIDELLRAEGLRWRTQESWCGEKAASGAPECAEKRGRSSGFTPTRRTAA